MGTVIDDRRELATKRISQQRHFKIQLAIFVSVNTLLVIVWVVATVAGAHVSGELWPWPVAIVIWGAYVAAQGYAAYHPPTEQWIDRKPE